jgi:hypothetical protein
MRVMVFFRGLGGLQRGRQETEKAGGQDRAHGYRGAAAPESHAQAKKHQDT